MKIKNKILLTSFLTMLFALIALLLIGGFVIRFFASQFVNDGIPELNQNMFVVEDLINSTDVTNKDWTKLAGELSDEGYSLYVSHGGDVTYSNFEHHPKNMIAFLENVNWTESGRSFSIGQATIVGKKSKSFTVVALNSGYQQSQLEYVLKAFIVIGLLTIAIILTVSQFFTIWIGRRIMRPINALTDAANRIVQGNLSEPIIFDGKDELTSVCYTFNQMQRHLQIERERNASYEKARTDMIAGISHDLRTPLTSVKGYIKGLRDGVANTPEKQELYLSIAYNKANEMDALLQKLFYFSKLETGNLPLILTNEDLGNFAKKYALQSQEELAQINVQIIATCETDDNPVQIDTEQMHRVFSNLTENALKYAGSNSLLLSIKVWKENDVIHLSFSDNGKGVAEEQLENLFVQFWRGDPSRGSRDGRGSGLGLNIVKYIVEAHGGTVFARNDNGLVIDILLPARKET